MPTTATIPAIPTQTTPPADPWDNPWTAPCGTDLPDDETDGYSPSWTEHLRTCATCAQDAKE